MIPIEIVEGIEGAIQEDVSARVLAERIAATTSTRTASALRGAPTPSGEPRND